MIPVNQSFFKADTCSQCGLCEAVCPNRIIEKTTSGMKFRSERSHLCFNCAHCMSICPTGSVHIDGLSYDQDFLKLPEPEPYEGTFRNMLISRRAVRNFKEIPVPRELLEKIVEAVTMAPPGFPPPKTEITVVEQPEIIKKALPHMIELYAKLVKAMEKRISRYFIRKEIGIRRFKQLENHLIPMMKVRLPGLKAGTEDTITRNAPAMILFHTNQEEDIHEDIYIAAAYCMLTAHSLGLGGSVMDIIPPAINKSKELRNLFQLPEDNEVIASVILGYPKYAFRRGIKRSIKSVTWL